MLEKNRLNDLTECVIGLCIKIHKQLGPGFKEKIYEKALAYEFEKEKVGFKEQKQIRVKYESLDLGSQRVDFIVEESVILELKSVSGLWDIHFAQMLSYLKTTGITVGLLLNFGKKKMEIKRIVNNYKPLGGLREVSAASAKNND